MNIAKKITQIFLTISLLFALASCDTGCVSADEFDTESVTVSANPTMDGVTGTYDSLTGGQTAVWHDTGLKSNGDDFLIYISGSWLPWKIDDPSKATTCDFCAKGNGATNCICYAKSFKRVSPQPENGNNGLPRSDVDCSTVTDQNDPAKCTCTQQFGAATDYGNYHFSLGYYNKDETRISDPNLQTPCMFNQGMGAYISLWGKDGVTVPNRVYHLLSEEPICDIKTTGEAGTCIDDKGNDATKYVFRSTNSRIFMKDDNAGNNAVDTNTADDSYHIAGEKVKVIIYDDYYSDNTGQYNLTFLRGVGESGDAANAGLIEYLVRTVENVLLGKTTYQYVVDGDTTTVQEKRTGGIIEGMYKSLVQDSGFVLIVQMALGFYVAFFGAAHLMGVVELSAKELMSRMVKIVLIIFFISPNSWYFYDQIIVGFFKDSMNYVVAMVMDLSDKNLNPTSAIVIAQMDRATDVSSATRFSYVDLMIKKLLSESSAKKIFGLFFGAPFFGLLYIPIIYGLIAYFIYVMLFAAGIYLISLMKIIFVLALGPLFMCFALFKQTEGMFKKWVAFLGGRSFEILVVFLVLYNFLNLLDIYFSDLLHFSACPYSWGITTMKINVIRSSVDNRNLVEWFTSFLTIGGLIFITQIILAKVGSLADSMFTVMGTKSEAGPSAGSAGNLMSEGLKLAQMGFSKALETGSAVGTEAIKAGTLAARKLGIADALDRNTDFLPSGPRSWMRNLTIDGAINQAKKEAASQGLVGKAAESHIRSSVIKAMQLKAETNAGKMALAGIDMKTTLKRLDEKLVKEPLKNFLKEEAKKMKSADPDKILFGEKAEKHLRDAAENWASSNLVGGSDAIKDYLGSRSIKNFMREEAELTLDEAAKKFSSNKEKQNEYLKYLKDNKFIRDQETEKKWIDNWGTKSSYGINSLTSVFTGKKAISRPEAAQEIFAAKVVGQEAIKKAQEEYKNKKFSDGGLSGAIAGAAKRAWYKTAGAAGRVAERNISAFGHGGEIALEKDKAKKDIKRNVTLNYLAEPSLEESKKAFLMRQLRDYSLNEFDQRYGGDLTTPNIVTQARSAEARRLENESRKLKNDAFDQAFAAFSNKADKRTVYEKAADLNHLYHQFGVKDKGDPLSRMAETLNSHVKNKEDEIREGLAKRTMSYELAEKELQALEPMRKGLFVTEMNPQLEAALKEIIDEGKNSPIKLAPGKEAAPDSTEAIIKAQDETDKSLTELSDFVKTRKAEEEKIFAEAWDELRNMKVHLEPLEKAYAERSEQINKDINDIEDRIAVANPANIKEVKDLVERFNEAASQIEKASNVQETFAGVIPTGMSVEFGATLSDILIKTPDVGLKAGNPFLGVPNADPAEANQAYKDLLKLNKMQVDARLKVANLNKKIKEFELEQIRKADPSDPSIKELEDALNGISNEVRAHESTLSGIENQLSSLA